MSENNSRPPRDNLCRALPRGYEIREADGDDESPVLSGHFARFDEWTEIDSFWEGRFMERIAPGAFKKTFRERTPKVLFNHGHDPTMGDQVLGSIREVREDSDGAYYEVDLFDGVPPILLSGLRAGEYGASFRFSVVREEFDNDPGTSDHNPEGIPERTIKEARVPEFGPVTFPAYEGATAQARSTTDDYLVERMRKTDPERLQALLVEQVKRLVDSGVTPEDFVRAITAKDDERQADEPAEQEERATGPAEDEQAEVPVEQDQEERAIEPAEAAPAEATPPEKETATDRPAPGLEPTPLRSTVAPGVRPTPLRGMNPLTRKDRL